MNCFKSLPKGVSIKSSSLSISPSSSSSAAAAVAAAASVTNISRTNLQQCSICTHSRFIPSSIVSTNNNNLGNYQYEHSHSKRKWKSLRKVESRIQFSSSIDLKKFETSNSMDCRNPNINNNLSANFVDKSRTKRNYSDDGSINKDVTISSEPSLMNALKSAATLTNEQRNHAVGEEKDYVTNLDSLIDEIKNNINEETKDGIDNAIQIIYSILESPSLYSYNNSTQNDNHSDGKVLQYNSIADSINISLNAGRQKMISNPNHADFISVALGLLQCIEMKLYKGQIHASPDSSMKNKSNTSTGAVTTNNHSQLRKTYNLVIDIVSKSHHDESIMLIQDILERMKNAPHEWDISPDTISYNSLLYAYSRQSYTKAAKECESLLQQMKELQLYNPLIQVDTISYNIVLNAWARSSDKASTARSEQLLEEMQLEYLNGNKNVKPNYITFTILFEAFSRSREIDAAQKATNLLHTMEELYEKGDVTLQPNILTYNAVLNTWSKSTLPGSSQRAQELLEGMIKKSQYHNLDGDSNSNCNGRDRKRQISMQPDKISFAICIKAYANDDAKGSSEKALSLLKQMIDLAQNQMYNSQPDIGTFNSVLRSLANDSNEEKAIKAENLLRQIEELGLHPDLTTYNSILRCCCTTKTENERLNRSAVRIASDVLLKLRQLIRHNNSDHRTTSSTSSTSSTPILSTDPYTFNFFIKTCDRLCKGEEKLKLIQAAFQFCIEEGMLNRNVLGILKNSLKPKDLSNLLGVDDCRSIKLRHLPKSWRSKFQQQYELQQQTKDSEY